MSGRRLQPNDPVEVVARSRRGMSDAIRQALRGAARTMGGLDSCEATISPQVLRHGSDRQFEIMLSVTRRRPNQPFRID